MKQWYNLLVEVVDWFVKKHFQKKVQYNKHIFVTGVNITVFSPESDFGYKRNCNK